MYQLKRKENGSHAEEHWKNGVLYFTFPALSAVPFALHGFSSRIGGVSEKELATMNLSFARGDDPERVRENFRRISEAIGFSADQMVFSWQTHTRCVRRMTEADRGKGFTCSRDYKDVDGMITDVPGLILTEFFADCVPLYFVDPVHQAVGLSHSGWRGTVSDIAEETVHALHDCYGTEPSDLIAVIGPSICQDCYEVGGDVIAQVRAHYDEALWPLLFEQKSEEKYQLNLWEACRQNLLRAGLCAEKISVTDLCTCCNPDIFFSHRVSHGKRGNLAAFIGIRES